MFRSGFCGFILTMGPDGTYVRRTWGKSSHAMCKGSVGTVRCMCDCHNGDEPWTKNPPWNGANRAFVMEVPSKPSKPSKPGKQSKPSKENISDAIADMQSALDQLNGETEGTE